MLEQLYNVMFGLFGIMTEPLILMWSFVITFYIYMKCENFYRYAKQKINQIRYK